MRMCAAEAGQPFVVDAHHLVGGFVVAKPHGRAENAVEHLALHAVEVLVVQAQVRFGEAPDALRAVAVQSLLRHPVRPVNLPRHIDPPGRSHAVLQPELATATAHPIRPLLRLGDVGHAFLQVRARLAREQIRRQPRQVDVTVRGDDLIVHGSPSSSQLSTAPLWREIPPRCHPDTWTGQISVSQPKCKRPTPMAAPGRARPRRPLQRNPRTTDGSNACPTPRFGQARFVSYRRPCNLLHTHPPPSLPGNDAPFGVRLRRVAASQPVYIPVRSRGLP